MTYFPCSNHTLMSKIASTRHGSGTRPAINHDATSWEGIVGMSNVPSDVDVVDVGFSNGKNSEAATLSTCRSDGRERRRRVDGFLFTPSKRGGTTDATTTPPPRASTCNNTIFHTRWYDPICSTALEHDSAWSMSCDVHMRWVHAIGTTGSTTSNPTRTPQDKTYATGAYILVNRRLTIVKKSTAT
ncbi:hypothetical protein H257_08253 [Aphanomyces astaci]|uniref:Uncharacterized protein n=1 Tax=Aphanomyces astaci TaxID=112090 RepID=W4GGE6_APHAT|nr:hypothetical protein H257_08253 [Aphanomyces astaci]ETV78038.1 hypothetical protein H257_08253 [Aphanomyces astaci]|eukprot:XP_009832375.1 hypothetical protein H257_08253 [Aphanomyces astaci]